MFCNYRRKRQPLARTYMLAAVVEENISIATSDPLLT
jgi:hypothetical protein